MHNHNIIVLRYCYFIIRYFYINFRKWFVNDPLIFHGYKAQKQDKEKVVADICLLNGFTYDSQLYYEHIFFFFTACQKRFFLLLFTNIATYTDIKFTLQSELWSGNEALMLRFLLSEYHSDLTFVNESKHCLD